MTLSETVRDLGRFHGTVISKFRVWVSSTSMYMCCFDTFWSTSVTRQGNVTRAFRCLACHRATVSSKYSAGNNKENIKDLYYWYCVTGRFPHKGPVIRRLSMPWRNDVDNTSAPPATNTHTHTHTHQNNLMAWRRFITWDLCMDIRPGGQAVRFLARKAGSWTGERCRFK